MKSKSVPIKSGFSLVELLSVTAIISILATMCIPALGSLLGTRGMTQAVSDLYDLIELARNKAMTSQGYVYLCLANTTNAQGNDELHAVVISSPGGKATSVSISGSSSLVGLEQTTRILKFENIKLVQLDKLNQSVQNLAFQGTVSNPLAIQDDLKFTLGSDYMGGKSKSASYKCIIFSPQGYALFQTKNAAAGYFNDLNINSPYEKFIDIGLEPTRGGVVQSKNPDQAALILNGVNGHTQILRL